MVPQSPSRGLQHAALFYDSDEVLTSTAVAFVREGVERHETVMVNTGSSPATKVLRAAFADEPGVRFGNSIAYASPVSAIDNYKRTMDSGLASGATAFRVVGSIDLESGPLNWLEWLRYEAVVNRVFAQYPFQTLCPYDTRVTDPVKVTAMRLAHPLVFGPDGAQSNEEYVDPVGLVARPEYSLPTDALQIRPPRVVLADVSDLRSLRIDLYSVLLSSPLSRKKTDDFVKAVGEVVLNGCAHGLGQVDLSLWTDKAKMICTVSDHGTGIADPFLGYSRPPFATGVEATTDSLGLWAARQLCDTLDYTRTDEGFTVRLTVSA